MVPKLRDFEGRWRIARTIEDRLGGEGRFDGEAVFAAQGAVLHYRETGELRLGDGPGFQAERSYLWRQAGGRIAVDFADGRAFHEFDPAAPDARHLCIADDYAVRYDFAGWPDWRAEWTVQGPRKDYTMVSRYRRIS
jgi:hypothetical protein